MNNFKRYFLNLWNYKFWLIGLTLVATAAAFILTLPIFAPKFYELRSEYKIKNLPQLLEIDAYSIVNQLRKDTIFQNSIISEYETINQANFSSYVNINQQKLGNLTIRVKCQDKEKCQQLLEKVYEAINQQIHKEISVNYSNDIALKQAQLSLKLQEKSELEKEIREITGTAKEIEIVENVDLFFSYSLLFNYASNINRLENEITELELHINNTEDYFNSINNVDFDKFTVYPNRVKIVSMTFFISFILLSFIFSIKEIGKDLKSFYKNNQGLKE